MRLAADFLPGTITIERGTIADYHLLAHFHYASGKPATWAGVWRATYADSRFSICNLRLKDERHTSSPRRTGAREKEGDLVFNRKSQIENRQSAQVIAVGVLSYPTPALRAREREIGLAGPRYGSKLKFVNQHVRTISRVIVHPQFRGMGIASVLVRRICEDCPTRYVEAIAAMGEVHPFFEKGGMRRVAGREGESAYFLVDREETR
jgi:GNAT superfamily N-acetyltransferase